MTGFSVVPGEVTCAARAVQELGDELAGSPVLRYRVDPHRVGDPHLAAALESVQGASRDAVELLGTTVRATATRLADSAEAYLDLDASLAEAIGPATP